MEQTKKQKADRDDKTKRENVPKVDDKPIMGLKSNKNFIIANAVQNILAAPKQQPEEFAYTQKKDYGQTPEYLTQINDKINTEYHMIRELQQQDAQEKIHEKYSPPYIFLDTSCPNKTDRPSRQDYIRSGRLSTKSTRASLT